MQTKAESQWLRKAKLNLEKQADSRKYIRNIKPKMKGMRQMEKKYTVGKTIPSWKEGKAQTITFVVTEDCNLRCKYCYITHKASNKKMELQDAKKFIDYILTTDIQRTDAVIIEFIGGEPFIEVELIDKISDYFKKKAFELNHEWFWNYRFSICTNGVNYSNECVQKYIKKNYGKLSVSITLDGTKEKHDLQRVFPDGTGSYDAISKNIDLWKSQFKGTTKVTFASDDLPLLKDSILDLWNRGIEDVAANVVFEDVWKENDDKVFESQLKSLADYILDKHLFDRYSCTLFDEKIGGYIDEEQLSHTSCGAGKMMALGTNGKIYPCIRYMSYSLNKQKEWSIGNIDEGINMEYVRPFMAAMIKYQSDKECLECPVANGCRFCQGFNYDESISGTNFYRAKYICKMHKAQVRANDYYFAKLFNQYGIKRDSGTNKRKRMYFLLSDDFVQYCSCEKTINTSKKMKEQDIINGLEYAYENFLEPIFVHSNDSFSFENKKTYDKYLITHIIPAKFFEEAKSLNNYILVYDHQTYKMDTGHVSNSMLNVRADDLKKLAEYAIEILKKVDRININIIGIDSLFDENEYRKQLIKVMNCLIDYNKKGKTVKEINLITDLCYLNRHEGCSAGDQSFVYAANGNFYPCSADDLNADSNTMGGVKEGIKKLENSQLLKIDHMPLCEVCDAFQCSRCIKTNKDGTKEVNIPPSFQCRKSFIEREIARIYQQKIGGMAKSTNIIPKVTYEDPMSLFYKKNKIEIGYYKLKKEKKNG